MFSSKLACLTFRYYELSPDISRLSQQYVLERESIIYWIIPLTNHVVIPASFSIMHRERKEKNDNTDIY